MVAVVDMAVLGRTCGRVFSTQPLALLSHSRRSIVKGDALRCASQDSAAHRG